MQQHIRWPVEWKQRERKRKKATNERLGAGPIKLTSRVPSLGPSCSQVRISLLLLLMLMLVVAQVRLARTLIDLCILLPAEKKQAMPAQLCVCAILLFTRQRPTSQELSFSLLASLFSLKLQLH